MSQETGSALKKLIELSKIDVSIAQIEAERKKNDLTLANKRAAIKTIKDQLTAKEAIHKDKNGKYLKEEKSIKEEQEKLVARRKALATFSNYKVQQAAEKEIEQAAKMLSGREDLLLALIEEVEVVAKEVAALTAQSNELKTEFEKIAAEISEQMIDLEERQSQKAQERAVLLADIPQSELAWYDKIRGKYPLNPLSLIFNNTCSGCHMHISPQVVVQTAKAAAISRCPGCGRILYIQEQSS